MRKTKCKKKKGELFVVCPTLDIMLASCDNIKDAAHKGGYEYSNFLKACKLETDVRISTYQKCAAAFEKDVLIIHLPVGLIDSVVSSTSHLSNRCYTIMEADCAHIFREYLQYDKSPFFHLLDEMLENGEGQHLKTFLTGLHEIIHQLLKKYDNE